MTTQPPKSILPTLKTKQQIVDYLLSFDLFAYDLQPGGADE